VIDDAKLIEFESTELFLISFDSINSVEVFIISSLLADKTFEHCLTAKDEITIFEIVSYVYIIFIESRYNDSEFQSMLVNCEAARRSTAEIGQFTALQRLNDLVKMNKLIVELKIQFGIDSISIMNTIELNISIREIIFHIVEINTSFLLCLVDWDRLGVYFNNLINELVQKRLIIIILQIDMKNFSSIIILRNSTKNVSYLIILQIDMKNVNPFSIIRRCEHAFILWKILNQFLIVESFDENSCYRIEIELRRLHRRFDHFSARRLHEIITGSDHDVESWVLEHLNKYCHHCQMHETSSDRFSFIIRDEDIQFNFNILMNILYVKCKNENKSVLHLVNEAIRF
jgi:hypothetical protein